MKKIAILGCENSHANTFLKFIKEQERYQDVEVVGVYSHDATASEKLNAEFGVPVLSSYEDAVGKVDGLIITARHGDNHYKYAKPYIESGIPMFIDKPITVTESDAVEFMQACQRYGVKLVGGSSCKHADAVYELKADAEKEVDGKTIGGFVRCPVSLDNPNGGFFFYAQHLVEIVCAIFGQYPKNVKAYKNDGQVTVIFRYEKYDVVGLFVNEVYTCYYAARVAEKNVKGISFDMFPETPYLREFEEFYNLLCGKAQPISYKDFVAPVFIMNAIKYSMDNGVEVEVKTYGV